MPRRSPAATTTARRPAVAPPPDDDDDAFAASRRRLVDDDDDEDALLARRRAPHPSTRAGSTTSTPSSPTPTRPRPASSVDRRPRVAPNTVKVATLLRDHLADRDALSFGAFTRGADKRSAASAFVELLHLKTWDFVALDQPHAYGDISIVKAACFHDEVPAAA